MLALFLGSIGIHDFYLGYTKYGIIKIVLTVCTGVGGSIWALVDLIRLLTGSLHTDANGNELKKEF
ncbi:MAG: TM2 domain-containing protein [Oscillospiraceae bacterium]|nr:TM2 domain-containing protein [Oscillospiraceae bacterium]